MTNDPPAGSLNIAYVGEAARVLRRYAYQSNATPETIANQALGSYAFIQEQLWRGGEFLLRSRNGPELEKVIFAFQPPPLPTARPSFIQWLTTHSIAYYSFILLGWTWASITASSLVWILVGGELKDNIADYLVVMGYVNVILVAGLMLALVVVQRHSRRRRRSRPDTGA